MRIDLDQFHERAAIREFCGGMTRFRAETEAARDQGFERWQVMEEIKNGHRGGNSTAAGDRPVALARERGADDLPGMQRGPEEENGSLPVGQPEAGRDRDSLLALRSRSGREV